MALPQLPQDFSEFLRSLNSNNVEYLLIGGVAVNAYGHHRMTSDLDVWTLATRDNGERLKGALAEFGFRTDLSADAFAQPGKIFRMGHIPLRIEVLTSIAGVEFEACYLQRVMMDFDGVLVPVISIEHLQTNKRAAGRYKDLADVEALTEIIRRTR